MPSKYISVLASLSILSTGCATIVTGGGHTQSVRFNSTPTGATVYVDNNRIGLTPISAPLTRHDNHLVRAELYGYATQTAKITAGINWWGIGNAAFGLLGIVFAIVDLSSGAAEGALSPTNQEFKMVPLPHKALPALDVRPNDGV